MWHDHSVHCAGLPKLLQVLSFLVWVAGKIGRVSGGVCKVKGHSVHVCLLSVYILVSWASDNVGKNNHHVRTHCKINQIYGK